MASLIETSLDFSNGYLEEEKPESLPKAMIPLREPHKQKFLAWLHDEVEFLINSHSELLNKFAIEEDLYRALPQPPKERPFKGACNLVVPAVAMAVDPIHARLDTGIFKNDQIYRLKALDKTLADYMTPLEKFVHHCMTHVLKIRQVAVPRFLELTKHGTCVFRVTYEDDRCKHTSYVREDDGTYKIVKKDYVKYRGPKVVGVPLQNFIFPPRYQNLQDCPIVVERFWLSPQDLKVQQMAGSLADVELSGTDTGERTIVDQALEDASSHHEVRRTDGDYELFRFCCRYDVDGDGYLENLIGIYHRDTNQLLQLRYNWYNHQLYDYVLIPYAVTNGSLQGIGLTEMIAPFQEMITQWFQHSSDNAYLANARVVVRKRGAVEDDKSGSWYAGKEYFAENPREDLIALQMGDIYNSSIQMIQTLMGWVEKRTGVSDYLTGRESPIVGSRATATSTVALIQEGTKRVEETLENIRVGMSQMLHMCFSMWIQFGTDEIERRVFDEETANKIREFFDNQTDLDIGAALSIDLAATDAANNKVARQQAMLAVINMMLTFFQKIIEGGQLAIQSQDPRLAGLVATTLLAAHKLFKDFLSHYDVPNPEQYLPEIEEFITQLGATGDPQASGALGAPGGTPDLSGMEGLMGLLGGGSGQVQTGGGAGGGPQQGIQSY